jgi:hypothetical protein
MITDKMILDLITKIKTVTNMSIHKSDALRASMYAWENSELDNNAFYNQLAIHLNKFYN